MLVSKLISLYGNVIAAAKGTTKAERRLIREGVRRKYRKYLENDLPTCTDYQAYTHVQDVNFPTELEAAEKIMIILAPEHNAMSGGIYSFFSIANQARQMKSIHGYEIVIMTRPTAMPQTYFRNTKFKNSENVFRFLQIQRCTRAKDVYIHIPEYAVRSFLPNLTPEELHYLTSREKLHINILNQNTQLMPDRPHIDDLRSTFPDLSQSVAHHAYFSQDLADKYNLPTLLLPAYTDLSPYPASTFHDKEKLIIYSPDDAPFKKSCLKQIADEMPDYRLVEIKDVTFDHFMDLATRCMYSITFGEGYDGYFNQPIQQGGVSFAVFNNDFFPSGRYRNFLSVFESGEQMVQDICKHMKKLAADEILYKSLSSQLRAEHDQYYSLDDYKNKVSRLCKREFELHPQVAQSA